VLTDSSLSISSLLVDNNTIRTAVLEAVELSLTMQLKAIRALRSGKQSFTSIGASPDDRVKKRGKSHIDMTLDILKEANQPLHITEIIKRISLRFAVAIDRESLVSALTKRVRRGSLFVRTSKNTFSLIQNDNQQSTNL